MCGEHVLYIGNVTGREGSSPHVRGAHSRTILASMVAGIIPACAGSTSTASTTRLSGRDHPRMCGEHEAGLQIGEMRAGSSPHVRGARLQQRQLLVEAGIIPACAGST